MAKKLPPDELQKRLRTCRREYARIKARIRDVGFICEGSLVERWMACGKPNCRCSTDPTYRHGPYHQLSWKERGKTVSRRLPPGQARLYQEWIANRRQLDALLDDLKAVSREAGRYLLDAAADSAQDAVALSQRPRSRRPRRP
jgi:hypothetical protein